MSNANENPFPASDNVNGTDTTGRAAKKVLNNVVEGAHKTIDRLAETAVPHVQRLQEGVASASGALNAGVGKAREVGDEWTQTLRCTVRENPLSAVAAALAVGMLFARLTAGR